MRLNNGIEMTNDATALSRRIRLPGRRLPRRLRLGGQPHRRQSRYGRYFKISVIIP